MARRQIFYSFHFTNDVMRVQQVRNIGSIEGNQPVSINRWEEIKRKGNSAVETWIDENMKYKSCVVVLIGTDTYKREWVKKEIEKAWENGKGLLGIYIHNINCPRNGTCQKGSNPFEQFTINNGKTKLSDVVKCYNPNTMYTYSDIQDNITTWIEEAIKIRNDI